MEANASERKRIEADNDNDIDNDIDIDRDREKRKRFTPPTAEEVAAYIREKGYSVNAERFIDFYSSKGWLVGNAKMKDWKAAVRTWESRDKKQLPERAKEETAEEYAEYNIKMLEDMRRACEQTKSIEKPQRHEEAPQRHEEEIEKYFYDDSVHDEISQICRELSGGEEQNA